MDISLWVKTTQRGKMDHSDLFIAYKCVSSFTFALILRITILIFIRRLAASSHLGDWYLQPFVVARSITLNRRRQRSRSTLTSAKNAIEGLRADKYLVRRSTRANLWSTETSGETWSLQRRRHNFHATGYYFAPSHREPAISPEAFDTDNVARLI